MKTTVVRQQIIAGEKRLIAIAGPVLRTGQAGAVGAAEALCSRSPTEIAADVEGKLAWGADGAYGVPETLAIAYLQTGEKRYAEAAAAWYAYCIEANRLTEEDWLGPRDTLHISHGLGGAEVAGWLGCLPHLCPSEAFSDDLLADICCAARNQLNALMRNFDPFIHNIRMTGLDVYLTTSLRLSFLEDAPVWQEFAVKGLNDIFFRIFEPDGSSIESTGWYHHIVANMALRIWRIAQAMPELKLRIAADTVARAFDYTAACIEPCGHFNRIGDSTAQVYPLEALHDFLEHRKNVLYLLGKETADPSPRQVFPDTGQAILRTDWTEHATCLTFDATTFVSPAWHWHPGCNSVNLSVNGVRMLVDPGRMFYDPTPQKKYAISTRSHNTVNINGWNQSHSRAVSLRHGAADGVDVIESLYTGGYVNGLDYSHVGRFELTDCLSADHLRTVLWVHDRCFVVIDHVHNHRLDNEHPVRIESNWQTTPGEVVLDGDSALIQRDGAALRMVFALHPVEATLSVHCGETEPVRGWIADDADNPLPAPQVSLCLETLSPSFTELVTILIPGVETPPAVEILESLCPTWAGHGKVAFRWPDGTIDAVYWRRELNQALWEIEDFETDANLAYISRTPSGKPGKVIIYQGSYITPWQADYRLPRATCTFGEDGSVPIVLRCP